MKKIDFDKLDEKLEGLTDTIETYEEEMKSICTDFIEDNIPGADISECEDLDDFLKYISKNYNRSYKQDVSEDNDEKTKYKDKTKKLLENLASRKQNFLEQISNLAQGLINMQESILKLFGEITELKRKREEKEERFSQLEEKYNDPNGYLTDEELQEYIELQEMDKEIERKENRLGIRNEQEWLEAQDRVRENKAGLAELLVQYDIQLSPTRQGQTQNTAIPRTQGAAMQGYPGSITGGSSNYTGSTQRSQNQSTAIAIKTPTSREEAKRILYDLSIVKDSRELERMIDGKGYGDLEAAIKHLGWFDRRELRTFLQNRIEELEGVETIESSSEIKDFLEEFGDSEPSDIEDFEKRLNKTKYEMLIQETKKTALGRKIKEIFSKGDAKNRDLLSTMREYSDLKAQRREEQTSLLSSLRVSVGKTPIAQRPENPRANANPENKLTRRGVPTER